MYKTRGFGGATIWSDFVMFGRKVGMVTRSFISTHS